MKNREFTPEQSLKLMEKTILEAKNRFYYNGIPLILWGGLIALNLAVNYFLQSDSAIGLSWLITYILGLTGTIIWGISFKKAKLSTKLDKQIGRLWMGYGILIFSIFITTQISHTFSYYVPGTLAATAFTTYVMWFLINFRPLLFGSLVFLAYAFTYQYFTHFKEGYFIASIVMMLGYVIPGYLMYKRSKTLKTNQNAI